MLQLKLHCCILVSVNIFQKLSGLFKKKKEKSVREVLTELHVGDLVYLEYRHPAETGIIGAGGLTYTRLNDAELANREVKGAISGLWKKTVPFTSFMLEVSTYGSPAMPGHLRRILFLDDEIKTIRKV